MTVNAARTITDPAATAALDWLQAADDVFLACRGNHRFPKLVIRKGTLPRGITAARQRDGAYQIRETCPDCGTVRWYETAPDGWIDGAVRRYRYEWPDGYRMPAGAAEYVSTRDCQAELWRRTREVLDGQQRGNHLRPV